ncbi:hypothetical protein O181_072276 [Austropuccinia psidii MF-1]|uniref:Uncharacterized protein n=1 Tax=Austropuccinia psidii MF-1 TaxID=1389203 RepID=A0A9Q3F2D4_9BASI|nr:hypothetical protein [Austropuccinia psidii MF-1]
MPQLPPVPQKQGLAAFPKPLNWCDELLPVGERFSVRGEEQRIGRRFSPNAGQSKGSADQSLAEKYKFPVRRPEEIPERQSAYTNRNAKRFRKQGGGPKGSTRIQGTPQISIS